MKQHFFENNLWHWLGKLPELCGLSILWLVCSLPIITLIPASVALYDAVSRNLRPDLKGVYRRFFRTFKNELLRGILISLLWGGLILLLSIGFRILIRSSDGSGILSVYTLVYQVSFLLPLAVLCWLIPIESRFVYPYWQLQKNALIFTVAYLPRTALLLLVLALGVLACWYVPVLILPIPAVIALLHSIPVENVFKDYMPEEES